MDSVISELNNVEEISIEPEPKSLIPSRVSILLIIFIIILIVIVRCMGKKFKHWLTLILAKTRQTSAAFDGRVGVDNTKGVGAAITLEFRNHQNQANNMRKWNRW
jgi:Na+-transporting methylmalonyl-CoA/oxaloacetate decarboxylase gamma subunit